MYATLADVPAPVDVVDIFRNSDAALAVTREAIALKDKLGLKVLWMQLGVRNDEAAREAEAAGLKVIMNRCPKIEYGRLSGEIGWAGVNSGTISSVRPKLAALGVQSLASASASGILIPSRASPWPAPHGRPVAAASTMHAPAAGSPRGESPAREAKARGSAGAKRPPS